MRGKVQEYVQQSTGLRITPAYAGKRISGMNSAIVNKDHPRLCGEKTNIYHFRIYRAGSPPPMRGKECFEQLYKNLTRITPAYAGKSSINFGIICSRRDHPRLCGEKGQCLTLPCRLLGSPPPMRGKGGTARYDGLPVRITPAYAGKSLRLASTRSACRDHPRLCGEKWGLSDCCK